MPATSSSLPAVLRAATTAGLPSGQLSTVESISLVQALGAVPDPRHRRGRRHSLQSVLLLALGAVLAGARSYAAIADWAAQADHAVAVCGPPPHASTVRRLLSRLDTAALEAALTRWVLSRRQVAAAPEATGGDPAAESRRVLAVDGKTLRGARGRQGRQAKLVCVYDHAHQLVLTQTGVVDGDEIAAFTAALSTLPDLHDVLVTADALHCQRQHAAWLHTRGGHYLFTVKSNQPALRQALAALPWGQVPGSRRRQLGHGRVESRSIKVVDLDGHPAQALFPHAAQAIKVVRSRHRTATGIRSTEIVYAVTSLTYRQAQPALLAAWIQGHWSIENAVHYIRDVTQGEDSSSVRAGSGPQVMAALRNTALNLNRLDGHTNIAQAQRRASWQPGTALKAIHAA